MIIKMYAGIDIDRARRIQIEGSADVDPTMEDIEEVTAALCQTVVANAVVAHRQANAPEPVAAPKDPLRTFDNDDEDEDE